MRSRLPGRRVLYVQYTNPGAYPPVHHSARILAEAGFDVLLLGTSRAGDPLRVPDHDHVRVETMRFEPAGWKQKTHYLRFAAWVMASAVRWRPTWVYASDPLSCPVALALSRLVGAKVIYHEHDSPGTELTSGREGSLFLKTVMKARRALATISDLCILPNEQRSEAFRRDTGRRDVLTVWNCPMPHEVVDARAARAEAGLRVLYHGSIVPSRLPATVLEALAQMPATVSLGVIGYETVGHRGYVASLKTLAAQLGIADRVTFLGAVPRADLMRLCGTYDVGLALMPGQTSDVNQRAMVGASNKPFDYLACGLALLVADLPEWRALYVDPGFGLCCDPASPDSIRAALGWMLDQSPARTAMGERGRRQILADWNYERRFAPVLSLMQAPAGLAVAG
jgi:glycosyltransferase involved in cell wall biosynthesis